MNADYYKELANAATDEQMKQFWSIQANKAVKRKKLAKQRVKDELAALNALHDNKEDSIDESETNETTDEKPTKGRRKKTTDGES